MCRQQSHFIFLGKLCGSGGQQIRQSPHLSIRAVIWTSPSDSWIGRRQSCLRRMVQSNIGPISDIFWAKWLPAIPQYLCPRVLSELQFVHFLISYFWQWRMICGWHNSAMWNLWWYYWHPSFISRSPPKRENQSNLCNIFVQNKTSPPNFGCFVNWAHEQMERCVSWLFIRTRCRFVRYCKTNWFWRRNSTSRWEPAMQNLGWQRAKNNPVVIIKRIKRLNFLWRTWKLFRTRLN